MDNKANLNDVDASSVTLIELVNFIDRLRDQFPVAIRVLTKRLISQEYGMQPEHFGDMIKLDEDKIIESLGLLRNDMNRQAKNESNTILVLSLHSTFGFGKKRILRLWGQAADQFGGRSPSVEELVAWCEKRGIEYDQEFGIGSDKPKAYEQTN